MSTIATTLAAALRPSMMFADPVEYKRRGLCVKRGKTFEVFKNNRKKIQMSRCSEQCQNKIVIRLWKAQDSALVRQPP